MSNIEEPSLVINRTSLTLDEAAARLMGWMHGPNFRRPVRDSESGTLLVTDLPFLAELDCPLPGLLNDMRADAFRRLNDAAKNKADPSTIKDLADEVVDAEENRAEAMPFWWALNDAAANLEECEFVTDTARIGESGETYYTSESLDAWARKNFGIPIARREGETNEIADQVEMPYEGGGLKRTSATSLYMTFALLFVDYVKHAPRNFRHPNDDPNVDVIVGHLSSLAMDKFTGKPEKGQGHESIKNRIESAMATLRTDFVRRRSKRAS